MKNNLFKSVSLTLVLSTLASCSESWLDPEPLSFYEPNITFSTVEGLEGALTRCRSDMLYYFLGSNGTAVSTELIFSDVEILERRIAKTTRGARNDKALAKELDFQQRMKAFLEEGNLAIKYETEDEDELAWLAEYNLLTYKPVIFAANVSEDDLADDGNSNPHVEAVRKFAAENGSEVFVISAEIEQEISELDDDEKQMFLEDLGISESGLDKLIKASYSLLGLISYLTSGEDETRAWTIKKGTKAPQAAGKIHTDFERGFICAEVVAYKDLIECGSLAKAKEKGLVGLQGKDYVVQDGDVITFRFNV